MFSKKSGARHSLKCPSPSQATTNYFFLPLHCYNFPHSFAVWPFVIILTLKFSEPIHQNLAFNFLLSTFPESFQSSHIAIKVTVNTSASSLTHLLTYLYTTIHVLRPSLNMEVKQTNTKIKALSFLLLQIY